MPIRGRRCCRFFPRYATPLQRRSARRAPPATFVWREGEPMPDEAFIHIVRVDIDPEHEAAFNAWYEQRHFPDLLACPGWLSAKRFVSVGEGPKYAAMYEVAGRWAFETPEFLKVKGFGPFETLVKNFMRIQLKPTSGPA
jgi:hypothetical protein